ncbi:MAG: MaoC family dehydratase [Alphaproteobacteria bacterium]
MKEIAYNDLTSMVGQDIGVSDWFEVTQDRVNLFADATGDHQWIHVDPDRAAKELPTGTTIAHGFLTLSLIPVLGAQIMRVTGVNMGINYGCNKVRFTSMVPVGSKVRARQKLTGAEPKGGGIQLISEFTIEIDGQDRPACIAESLTILYPAG